MAHQRVLTRLLLPPGQRARATFAHSQVITVACAVCDQAGITVAFQPDKLGLRVLVSSHGDRQPTVINEVEKSLRVSGPAQISTVIEAQIYRNPGDSRLHRLR